MKCGESRSASACAAAAVGVSRVLLHVTAEKSEKMLRISLGGDSLVMLVPYHALIDSPTTVSREPQHASLSSNGAVPIVYLRALMAY